MTVRRRAIVSGRVQGVFFRDTCRREATARDISGWVRNRPDGRVEACFEGEAAAVDAMIDWCRNGPQWADVDDVEVIDEAPTGETGFRIS